MNGQIPLQIDALAAALRSDADLIPLQRRIRRCRVEIYAILHAGVTVRALAEALASFGVTGQNGRPVSYGHMRVLLARIAPSHKPPQSHSAHHADGQNIDSGKNKITTSIQKYESIRPDFSGGLFSNREMSKTKNDKN